MNTVKRKELYKATIEKWGQTAQLEMAQEEATELALACRKFVRKPNDESFKALASEIADNEIMHEQIKEMYPSIQEYIDSEKDFKLNRLSRRVFEGDFESK